MQAIVDDGKYFRHRLEQLAQPPETVTTAEAAREALLVESRRASERAGELRAQLEERERAVAQRRGLESRARVLDRSEEHTSELQSRLHLVCRLLLEKKKKIT